MKQASAFPPNFIHSLDATHMMLTALECRVRPLPHSRSNNICGNLMFLPVQTKGLTFASVHDSYWTHAASIDEMSTIIRDTFIALHSSDVLDKLRSEVSREASRETPCYLTFFVFFLTAVPRTIQGIQSTLDTSQERTHFEAPP